MIIGQLALYTVANRFVTVVKNRFTEAGLQVPGRMGVVPGAIAWDQCDCNGQLSVTINGMYLSDRFPEPMPGNLVCAPSILVGTMAIHLARCVPNPDESGKPPSVVELDKSAQQWAADAYQILLAVKCEIQDMLEAEDIEYFQIGQLLPFGPQGGCIATELQVVIGLSLL